MSHEINEADGNIREIQRLRGLLAQAEADASALREAGDRFHYAVVMNRAFDDRYDQLTIERSKMLMDLVKAKHPGAALLSELEAARTVIQLARAGFGTEEDIGRGYAFDPVALTAAIRRYDEKARLV